jgi:dihydroflavonol-4-reductase
VRISSAPVLVTGATGFVGSQIVASLLDHGYRVRGSVRSVASRDVERLRALEGARDRLELFEADLLAAGAYDAPASGCEFVVHTASPYALDARDPQRDLVDPAVIGTENVLSACERARCVRRVVLTSSMAAVTDEPDRDHVLTENDWNERSSLSRNPYYFSKTQAERAAWAFMRNGPRRFDLVAINPFFVLGPSIVPRLNVSNQVLVDLLRGTYPGIVALTWGVVDVRDVADAHRLALETESAHGRYLCAGERMSMRDVVELLASHGWRDGYRLPRIGLDGPLGSALVRLASYTRSKGVGSYLRTHVGRVPCYDASRIQRELGVAFRPAAETVLDTMDDLARWGHLPRRKDGAAPHRSREPDGVAR